MTVKDKLTIGLMGIGGIGLTIGLLVGVVYVLTIVVKWAWEG